MKRGKIGWTDDCAGGCECVSAKSERQTRTYGIIQRGIMCLVEREVDERRREKEMGEREIKERESVWKMRERKKEGKREGKEGKREGEIEGKERKMQRKNIQRELCKRKIEKK